MFKGAGDIAKRVGRVYGWEATTREVDDQIFDDITKTFVLNEENFKFFEENNPWAMEEIGRRLLEAESRGLWNADPEVFETLKEKYLEIEGSIEDRMDDVRGDIQGGSVDIFTSEDVKNNTRVKTVVIDVEKPGLISFGLAHQLSSQMGAKYFKIEDLKADTLVKALREDLPA